MDIKKPDIVFNVHLVSDSTGETLNALLRASTARFDGAKPLEHNYYLVRSAAQMERVIDEIRGAPGIVFYTLFDHNLRLMLDQACATFGVPSLAILDPAIEVMSHYLGIESTDRKGGHRLLNEDYFKRMEAINFTLAHDDGQGLDDIELADVILTGVSRTSKTPTCVYLSNRGVRAANVPLVPSIGLPDKIMNLEGRTPIIIALKITPERLMDIRLARLKEMEAEERAASYADLEAIRDEIRMANRLYVQNKWKTIDVSRRSVEETSAAILNILEEQKRDA